ncbi:MAG: hypothetical protein ACLSTV_09430, partial [Coriobacteriales bacterium]
RDLVLTKDVLYLLSHNSITLFQGVFNDFAKVFFEAGCVLTKDVLYLLSHSSLFNFIQRISYYAIIVKNLFIVKSKKGVF